MQIDNELNKGLNLDYNPVTIPSGFLTNCLNGTIKTNNGNEGILQNDMGNAQVGTAYLPAGYVPLGMKEYGGIVYIVSKNPVTGKCLIGSFPSPGQLLTAEDTTNGINNVSISLDTFISGEDSVQKILEKDRVILRLTDKINIGDKYKILSINTTNNSTTDESFPIKLSFEENRYGSPATSDEDVDAVLNIGIKDSSNNIITLTDVTNDFNCVLNTSGELYLIGTFVIPSTFEIGNGKPVKITENQNDFYIMDLDVTLDNNALNPKKFAIKLGSADKYYYYTNTYNNNLNIESDENRHILKVPANLEGTKVFKFKLYKNLLNYEILIPLLEADILIDFNSLTSGVPNLYKWDCIFDSFNKSTKVKYGITNGWDIQKIKFLLQRVNVTEVENSVSYSLSDPLDPIEIHKTRYSGFFTHNFGNELSEDSIYKATIICDMLDKTTYLFTDIIFTTNLIKSLPKLSLNTLEASETQSYLLQSNLNDYEVNVSISFTSENTLSLDVEKLDDVIVGSIDTKDLEGDYNFTKTFRYKFSTNNNQSINIEVNSPFNLVNRLDMSNFLKTIEVHPSDIIKKVVYNGDGTNASNMYIEKNPNNLSNFIVKRDFNFTSTSKQVDIWTDGIQFVPVYWDDTELQRKDSNYILFGDHDELWGVSLTVGQHHEQHRGVSEVFKLNVNGCPITATGKRCTKQFRWSNRAKDGNQMNYSEFVNNILIEYFKSWDHSGEPMFTFISGQDWSGWNLTDYQTTLHTGDNHKLEYNNRGKKYSIVLMRDSWETYYITNAAEWYDNRNIKTHLQDMFKTFYISRLSGERLKLSSKYTPNMDNATYPIQISGDVKCEITQQILLCENKKNEIKQIFTTLIKDSEVIITPIYDKNTQSATYTYNTFNEDLSSEIASLKAVGDDILATNFAVVDKNYITKDIDGNPLDVNKIYYVIDSNTSGINNTLCPLSNTGRFNESSYWKGKQFYLNLCKEFFVVTNLYHNSWSLNRRKIAIAAGKGLNWDVPTQNGYLTPPCIGEMGAWDDTEKSWVLSFANWLNKNYLTKFELPGLDFNLLNNYN